MTIPDEQLVAALKHGDLQAYRELFERHGETMLRIGLNILGNRADAEDAVQETFLALFAKVGEFRGESAFFTWLYRIMVNASLMIRRKRPRVGDLQSIEIPVADPETASNREVRAQLEREIGRLPLQQRMVFTMAEVEGFGREEIAAILDLAPGTVRYHLFKARERLRRNLGPLLRPNADRS